jgi:hypothetical protein
VVAMWTEDDINDGPDCFPFLEDAMIVVRQRYPALSIAPRSNLRASRRAMGRSTVSRQFILGL